MDYAFKYAETTALESEDDYPYRGVDSECSLTGGKGKVKATGFKNVPPNEPDQMKAALK